MSTRALLRNASFNGSKRMPRICSSGSICRPPAAVNRNGRADLHPWFAFPTANFRSARGSWTTARSGSSYRMSSRRRKQGRSSNVCVTHRKAIAPGSTTCRSSIISRSRSGGFAQQGKPDRGDAGIGQRRGCRMNAQRQHSKAPPRFDGRGLFLCRADNPRLWHSPLLDGRSVGICLTAVNCILAIHLKPTRHAANYQVSGLLSIAYVKAHPRKHSI
jgi:hypothetical protein